MQNDQNKRTMSHETATQRLMAMCSRKEVSEGDVLKKLIQWGVDTEKHDEILTTLRNHNFVDNLRFAQAFANDKAKFNKWGPKKIEQHLAVHRIPKAIIESVLKNIETDDTILSALLLKKAATVKSSSSYDLRNKLVRFGLSRGFDLDIVLKAIKQIEKEQ